MKYLFCLMGIYSLHIFASVENNSRLTFSEWSACRKGFSLITPINQLEGLSERVKPLLDQPHPNLVGDLAVMTEEELKTMGLDDEAISEVQQALQKQDLSLGMEITDWSQNRDQIKRLATETFLEDAPEDKKWDSVFLLPIDELNFPSNGQWRFISWIKTFDKSTLAALKKAGKKLIGHLATTTEQELKAAGFDDSAVSQIKQVLSQRGMHLGMKNPSAKWSFQSAVAVAILESKAATSLVYEALKIQNHMQANVAIEAVKQYKPAFAINEALKIQNQMQADVAIMAMKQYNPTFAIREALKIQNQMQADVAIMAMKQYNPTFAVKEALKIQNQIQADFAIMAMEIHNPMYAVKLATRIQTRQMAKAVMDMAAQNRIPLDIAVEKAAQ